MTTTDKKRFVNASEIALMFGVTEQRIYEMARQGIIPHFRLGRQIRFDLQKIEEFVAQGGRALPGGWKKDAS